MNLPVEPSCAEAFLWIYDVGLDTDQVTSLLGVTPTSSRPGGVRDMGEWILSSLHNVESDKPLEHIEWVLDRIANCKTGLQQLQAIGVEVFLYCKLSVRGEETYLKLSPELMGRLSDLGLPFNCAVSCRPNT
jgi:hypothetical protein